MFSRRALFAALAIAGLALPAAAAESIAYTPAAFDAAQKAGQSVLVDVTAPWCPTCKAQKPILSKLESDAKFKALVVFYVDFDSQKDVLQRLGVRQQSTLITFNKGQETGRSVGDTNPDSLAALLDKAI